MIRPLYNNVLLEKCKEENETKSGIILSQKPKDEDYAIVVAVGDGKELDGKKITIPLKKKDKVLYKKYSGTEIKQDGHDYILIPCEDILAVIEK